MIELNAIFILSSFCCTSLSVRPWPELYLLKELEFKLIRPPELSCILLFDNILVILPTLNGFYMFGILYCEVSLEAVLMLIELLMLYESC